MQPAAARAASAGASIRATGSRPPVNAAARRITRDVADDERAAAASAERNQAAMISGPMPQASPIVSDERPGRR